MAVSFSVEDILKMSGGKLANADALGLSLASIRVGSPAELKHSKSHHIAFFFSRAYESEIPSARPGILITGEAFVGPMQALGLPLWKTSAVIVCADPYLAMAKLSEKFAVESPSSFPQADGRIHPNASVHSQAQVAKSCRIDANVVISKGAKIGERCILFPGVYVGENAIIGDDCVFFPNVVIYDETHIGNRARIHANTTIGSDGFGYAPRIESGKPVGHQKIYHLGRVVLGDDVEVGANSSIDRSTFGETLIEKNAKIDNQVQIGHNVRMEEGTIICGGTCVAGSVHIGKYVYIGGVTGITNQVYLGDGAKVAAAALITKDIPAGETAVGNPQRTHGEFFRIQAMLSRMLADRKKKRSQSHE